MNIIYRRSDGAIVGTPGYSLRPMTAVDVAPEYDVITDGDDDATAASHYITGSPLAAALRPATDCPLTTAAITADGTDEAVISGIPIGAELQITDANGTDTITATDATIEITADEPGQITVTITPAFPAKPLTVTITAT